MIPAICKIGGVQIGMETDTNLDEHDDYLVPTFSPKQPCASFGQVSCLFPSNVGIVPSLRKGAGHFYALEPTGPLLVMLQSRGRRVDKRVHNHGGWISENRAAQRAGRFFLPTSPAHCQPCHDTARGFRLVKVNRGAAKTHTTQPKGASALPDVKGSESERVYCLSLRSKPKVPSFSRTE